MGENSLRLHRFGPVPHAPRDGDAPQARASVALAVRNGRLPPPNSLPCADCGHIWHPGERRHEYDHHLGYAAEHHLHVQAVCTLCHHRRDNPKAAQAHCVRGHAFDSENTGRKTNGTRFCRECRRIFDRGGRRGKRDAAYWRNYRAQRKAASNG